MRETAFILRNIDMHSLAIIDELGRGTSTRDGLAIAIAIAEALVESRAFVWFATHFRELAKIMAERNGVVNMHLAVDMSGEDKMTMLYRLDQGVVTDEHYGLRLARVLPLPPDVLEYADRVARTLEEQNKQRQKASLSVIQARRRKLVLNLKEQLVQAYHGNMNNEVLRDWLKQLQREFVIRMTAIDEEARQAEVEEMTEASETRSLTIRTRSGTTTGSVMEEDLPRSRATGFSDERPLMSRQGSEISGMMDTVDDDIWSS